jgi:hypothetical protein
VPAEVALPSRPLSESKKKKRFFETWPPSIRRTRRNIMFWL